MKRMFLFAAVLASLMLFGCSHVSQGQLEKSQNQLRTELKQDSSDKSVAVLECVNLRNLVSRAWMMCQVKDAYCNVVETYESYCNRVDSSTGDLLPPKPGVGAALESAVEQENQRLENK